jgi:transposase
MSSNPVLYRPYNKADSDAVWENMHKHIAAVNAEQETMREAERTNALVGGNVAMSPISADEIEEIVNARLAHPQGRRLLVTDLCDTLAIEYPAQCVWRAEEGGDQPFATAQEGLAVRAALAEMADRKAAIWLNSEQARANRDGLGKLRNIRIATTQAAAHTAHKA